MAKSLQWFRLYSSDLMNDRKIKRIVKKTGINKATVLGVWVMLLSLANDSPERGKLLIDGGLPMEYEELADEVGLDILDFDLIIKQFVSEDFNMLVIDADSDTYMISHWDRRQYKSDSSAERTRKWRANKKTEPKDVTSHSRHTLRHSQRHGDVLDTESDTESDTETESGTAAVFSFFENNFMPLTPHLKEIISDALDTMPTSWIMEAMKISVERNARSWKYTQAILDRWKRDGKDDGRLVPANPNAGFDEVLR